MEENRSFVKKSRSSQIPKSVVEMTARDFTQDNKAYIATLSNYISDMATVEYFADMIQLNKHLFANKIVLNVGCDIGILALFAAKAGAAKVYIIEDSKVLEYAKVLAANNGLDHIIEVRKGRVEDIELPVDEVDIILSDWVGYSVLFKSRCLEVIYARDKWLRKTGGYIIPDAATLRAGGFSHPLARDKKFDWWYDVYGFDFKCIRQVTMKEVLFDYINPSQICTTYCVLKHLDLSKATIADLDVSQQFLLKAKADRSIDGVFMFLEIEFSKSHTEMKLHSDPWSEKKRWMQSLLYFDEPLQMRFSDVFYCFLEFRSRNKVKCDLHDMEIYLKFNRPYPLRHAFAIEKTWLLNISANNEPEIPIKKQAKNDQEKQTSFSY